MIGKPLYFAASSRVDSLGVAREEFYIEVLFDEPPLFVSDEATIWDVWSGDEAEIRSRIYAAYGYQPTYGEFRSSLWRLIELLQERRTTRRSNLYMSIDLHRELWTSWASVLRAYAGVHGMGAAEGAVVEVGPEEILLRVGGRVLRFTHTEAVGVDGVAVPFSLDEDGTATLGSETDEMDLLAERLAREMMSA